VLPHRNPVDVERSRWDIILGCDEEGNAEFSEGWNKFLMLAQVLPRYKKQEKGPNLFRFDP
jgi:hypothetical protein